MLPRIAIYSTTASSIGAIENSLGYPDESYIVYTSLPAFLEAVRFGLQETAIVDVDVSQRIEYEVAHLLLREACPDCYLIFLVENKKQQSNIDSLKSQLSECCQKPLSPGALRERLEELERLKIFSKPKAFEVHGVTFFPERTSLVVRGCQFRLTKLEFGLATLFFRNAERNISRKVIRDRVWTGRCDLNSRSIDTHIARLRKVLRQACGAALNINPIYGYGYRLDLCAGGVNRYLMSPNVTPIEHREKSPPRKQYSVRSSRG